MNELVNPNVHGRNAPLSLLQAESKNDIATMIKLQGAIKFNGGGRGSSRSAYG